MVLAALAAFTLSLPAWAADARFPFVIPGDDAAPTATDMSKLSPKPAGADGFVHIKDAHLVTDSGRLKIWGVNFCFSANFPTHEQAEKVAAHMAKLGINGVRIHHHETATSPRGLLTAPVNGKRQFDPQMLERQDYLLNEFHKHGIYVDLNLHVGRAGSEAEGFANVKELSPHLKYDKYILYFDPARKALLKEFCAGYLTHVNPYRKLPRNADPGVAIIEITNENAFSRDGAKFANELPEPLRGEFKRQWNLWLAKKYAGTDALKKAWGANAEPMGQTLADTKAWATGKLGPWTLHQSAAAPVEPKFNQPGPAPEIPAVKLAIVKRSAEVMQQELQFGNLNLQPGKAYTISYWIKADAPRTVHADVSNSGNGNWNNVGYVETLNLNTKWKRIHRVFKASDKIPGKVRICFKFGAHDASLYLADFTLRQGGEYTTVPAGQTLEQKNIEIPVSGWAEVAQADVKQFMADTETAFIREMSDFLKRDLHVRVPITASQITYHGAKIVADTCDYTDIHAYWQHPHFPGKPWDGNNWFIGNTPMELVPDKDKLLTAAAWRLNDRPFTISEWNIPDPNDYAASVVPFAALVAALQDWDGVFFFDYGNDAEWFGDRMHGYFSLNGQPAKLALLAACANLYRRGDLAPLTAPANGTLEERVPSTLGLTHRLGIDPKATQPASLKPASEKRLATPDARALWDATDDKQAYLQVNSPASRAVWGLVAGRSFNLGGVELKIGQTDNHYAALVLTTLDGQPVEKSKRLLLAAVGSAENLGMVWNDKRTTVGTKWGKGPTQVNGIPAEILLPAKVRSIKALDATGKPQADLPLTPAGAKTKFTIGPEHKTLWYEITAD